MSLWEFFLKQRTNYYYIKNSQLHSLKINISTEIFQVQKRIRRNFHTAEIHYGEHILRQNFRTAECPYGEISYSEISLRQNVPYGEISWKFWWKSFIIFWTCRVYGTRVSELDGMRFGDPWVRWLNRSVGRAMRVDANVYFGFTALEWFSE